MARYTNITLAEMAAFLEKRNFKSLNGIASPDLARTREVVYGRRVRHGRYELTLRVFTGIVDHQSRAAGTDAIRVVLFWRTPIGTVIRVGGGRRVHRVAGWRTNLEARIKDWDGELAGGSCPVCGGPLVWRKSKFKGQPKWAGCGTFSLHKHIAAAAQDVADLDNQWAEEYDAEFIE